MKISAVLVSFNDRPHLPACLAALRPELAGIGEIIVVDNASSDGSREWLAAQEPGLRLIARPDNAGFAAANNEGLRAASGEAVLFLNTDTAVEPGSIRRLLETLAENPDAAAVGPALRRPDGSFQVSFGRTVSFLGQAVQKAILNPYYRRRLAGRMRPRRAGWLSAACLLARAPAVRAVGGYDEDFFIYFEDIDLCRRLAGAGGRLLFDPRSRVLHEGGATTAPRAAASRFEYRRSQMRFYEKHASRLSRRLLRAYLRLVVALMGSRGAFRGPTGAALREKYRGLFRGKAPSA